MKCYLVGGAIRDSLLGFPVKEKDWVVVGASESELLEQGYHCVGKDFPVFLHPQSREEYALARTERKVAPGYKGFQVFASKEVTLEEDLMRRDFTINAMAQDEDGCIIDPYNGQADLKQRIFRHVSPAFVEDPVRILRLARFMARYRHLGFQVADETLDLIHDMVKQGETEHLIAERIWTEFNKALAEKSPAEFFLCLMKCQAMESVFPELYDLFGVPQPEQHHPEIDTGLHSLMSLEQATLLSAKKEVRFAALMHDLGKAKTNPEQWPSHHGHEHLGLPVLESFCRRLRVPNSYKKLALTVMKYHTHCHKVMHLNAKTLLKLIQETGALKSKEQGVDFVLACESDSRGRTGFENRQYPQSKYCLDAVMAVENVDIQSVIKTGMKGPEIADSIRLKRLSVLKKFIQLKTEPSV